MRALTMRQAAACENAKTPKHRCQCRCGGAGHGMARASTERELQELPPTDPHRLEEPKQKHK